MIYDEENMSADLKVKNFSKFKELSSISGAMYRLVPTWGVNMC